MNTSKHTPGPWACNVWMVGNNVPTGEITISGPEGDEHICTMDGNEDNLANGNLIAAAPAMYEALKAIQEKISGADVLFDPNPQWEGEQARYDAAQEALFLVDQALAQAEGK